MSHVFLSAEDLRQRLASADELALIDLRDEQAYALSAPFHGANHPFARFESFLHRLPLLIPHRRTPVVLLSDRRQHLQEAADALRAAGYQDVAMLPLDEHSNDGGCAYVEPGKVFAQRLQREQGTPAIQASDLQALREQGRRLVVLDNRTAEQYAKGHVPGALHVPGAELLLRLADLVDDSDTLVVVSCAAQPRGIVGAQTLIDAGIANPVAVLDNGTKGWTQAGFGLESGADTRNTETVSDRAEVFGRRHSEHLARRQPPSLVEHEQINTWLADTSRTSYLLDVRLPEAFARGHLPGSLSAPGGQLILNTLAYAVVRDARLLLVDDLHGVRATTAAYWLRQRGWDVHIHLHDFSAQA
ncbi:rhodanese-like domain-containing protein [Pseudomonas sp. LRF_L74]|uniref:rhodanese-like domain-containing protein n=1 Tax=Pseudomonas sp. LRF_L74 TaxID=3369422 RepID=UPI003F5F3A0B